MKRFCWIGIVVLLALVACHTPTREARRMIARAEQLADTLPDSTVRLIDSVLRMPVNLSERQRMDMALLQAEALFGDRESEISPVIDDDFFDDKPFLSTSPDLERAAAYYARKKQYDKAAQAALYSGFVQQHYDEKDVAMRSFKEAEQYGGVVQDSFTVALAKYRMGKMLYEDYMEDEAISMLKASDMYFGMHFGERAFVQNLEAASNMILMNFDSADLCLKKSLAYAVQSRSSKAKRKALNNYAVYHRLQGNYDQAITYLRQISSEPDLTNTEKTLLYLNFGKTFAAMEAFDSAALYYKHVEEFLHFANIKDETKASTYGALSRFAENIGDAASALQYFKTHENLEFEILSRYKMKSIFRIQQQYDYESLQNEMNQKLIHRHRIILLVSIFAILGFAALAVSQIRLAKIRKQEAAAKTNLFHFMQQHKELQQKHETSEQTVMNLSILHDADSKAHQDLIIKHKETEKACMDYAQKLSDALTKEALIMRKLGIYLDNKGEKAYLGALNDAVFGGADHWDALMKVFDSLYPDVRENLKLQHPELTEMEQKDFILSYFNVSREDEALMFNKSVHMVDKWRNSVRKKMQAFDAEERQKN